MQLAGAHIATKAVLTGHCTVLADWSGPTDQLCGYETMNEHQTQGIQRHGPERFAAAGKHSQILCRHPSSSSDGRLAQHSSLQRLIPTPATLVSRYPHFIEYRRISSMHSVDRILQHALRSTATAAQLATLCISPRPPLLYSFRVTDQICRILGTPIKRGGGALSRKRSRIHSASVIIYGLDCLCVVR